MLGAILDGVKTLLGSATAIKGTSGVISNYLKANPWVGTAASYAVTRRDANRAHRRQMNDLKRAGINPILSAKLGGAQTPTMGDLGQTQNTARQIDQTEKVATEQANELKQKITALASENVLKKKIAEYWKSEDGQKAIASMAQGVNPNSMIGSINKFIFGGAEQDTDQIQELNNQLDRLWWYLKETTGQNPVYDGRHQ